MQWKCVITGFEPFGNEDINPSWEVVKTLPDAIGEIQLYKQQIPTVFKKCFNSLMETIETVKPHVIICVGQAGGRPGISVEKVAINLMDARIPDNEGNQPVDEPILASQPAAFFTTLPIRSMVMRMREGGIPATVSYSAGTFVCNDVMYRLLSYLQNTSCMCGFIHVPYATCQAAKKGEHVSTMSIEDMAKGLELGIRAIEAALTSKDDSGVQSDSFGTIH